MGPRHWGPREIDACDSSQSLYDGDSKSPRKSAAKLLVFMGNSRYLYMLYINILLTYAQNLNKIG